MKKRPRASVPFAALIAAAAALAGAQPAAAPAFRLESPAFEDGGRIPPRYACDGSDASPPLRWSAPPAAAKSLALTVADDSSAFSASYWVVYNIPASSRELKSAYKWLSRRPDGTLQGRNSRDRSGYSGPCPDARHEGRYAFTLYALDALMPDKPGLSRADLAKAMEGHVLAQARLKGSYRRNF